METVNIEIKDHKHYTRLKLLNQLCKYQYTITTEHIHDHNITRQINADSEDKAIDQFLDQLSEDMRDDHTIDITDLSYCFESASNNVKVTEVKEIIWIHPDQLKLPLPAVEGNSKENGVCIT